MVSRRQFVHGLSLGVGLALNNPKVFATQRSLVIETSHGKVRGITQQGVDSFKGVRYGATTSHANRFLPPKHPSSWKGVFEADSYASNAMQSRSGSEDCLFLNVWTPSVKRASKRPVMVWLHGGGFRFGSGSSPLYDGTNLCNKEDVVVVTLNHRLNVFSATHLGHIIGDEFAESGCVGMLDIISALNWVKHNIENFSGDPGRVMIFGESGGGRKVSTLLAMPSAKGLFHSAAIQSGALLRVTTEEGGARQTDMLLQHLGLNKHDAIDLQSVPVDKLMAAQLRVDRLFHPTKQVVGMAANTPVLNPISLPAHPFDPYANDISSDVPVIVGYNRTEETFFYRLKTFYPGAKNRVMDFDLTGAQLVSRMDALLGVDSRALIAEYKLDYPNASAWDLQMLITTDHPRGVYPKELAIRRAVKNAANTYVYRLDWEIDDELKSPHGLDIPFIFANTLSAFTPQNQKKDTQTLTNNMSAAWAALARNGEPDAKLLPEWPAYDRKSRSTMIFNNISQVSDDPNQRSRLAMEKVLGI